MSKMKKLLVSLCALLAVCASANAQGMTATLQQGDKMTPYYGPDAFIQAYNAAPQKGAIITLSAGEFNTVDSITKQMTIIGNGCEMTGNVNKTSLICKVIDHGGKKKNRTSLIINASNVKVEGVYMEDSVYIRNISNTHLKRCYIFSLHGTHNHKNTIVEQSFIYLNYSVARSENMCFKNCFIDYLASSFGSEDTYKNGDCRTGYFSNCVIYHWRNFDFSLHPDYLTVYAPIGTYVNCILGQTQHLDSNQTDDEYWQGNKLSPVHFDNYILYHNVFFLNPYRWVKGSSGYEEVEIEDLKTMEMNMTNCVEDQSHIGNSSSTWAKLFNEDATNWWEKIKQDLPYKGDDGTVVGPYGGTGFSITPSIPRIVESKIDSNTDADGKLNVKIKVEVNQ